MTADSPLRLALIGFGGLGRIVAAHFARDPAVRFVAIAARARHEAELRNLVGDFTRVEDPQSLLATHPDVVIECASHAAFREYAEPVLQRGVALIAISVGVLADAQYRARVFDCAQRRPGLLRIPAGAIGGIDVITAARHAGLTRVTYVARKSPQVWRGTPAETMLELDSVREPVLFFDDTAERAASIFKAKANVAATLALAGIGFDATRVHFWADHAAHGSLHRIEAEGAFGVMTLDLANNFAPEDGRSSTLTAMSIVQAVRNRRAAITL